MACGTIAEAIHNYGPDYGFDTTVNKFDWDKLIASRTAYIDRIHTSYDNVLGKNNVDVIRGFAKFVDAHTVEVNGETITADHILIATGKPSAAHQFQARNMVLILTVSSHCLLCQNALRLWAQVISPLGDRRRG